MPTLRHIALPIEPLPSDARTDAAWARFAAEPGCTVLPVVEANGRPLGLVSRTDLAGVDDGALPLAAFIAGDPLTGEASMRAGDFAARTISAGDERLAGGFIVVEDGRYLGACLLIDLLRAVTTERARTARQLRELSENVQRSRQSAERQRRLAQAVIEHIPALVAVRSADTQRFILLNKAGEKILGIDRRTFVDEARTDSLQPLLAPQIARSDEILRELPPGTPREFRYVRPSDGEDRLLRVVQLPVEMPDGKTVLLSVAEDVTDARRAGARIEHLAHFDILTSLPNRALFHERLEEALDRADAARSGSPSSDAEARQVAVLAIDIDRFKSVNDTFGHGAGDMLLQEVALRLRAIVSEDGVAARIGGDEFAVVLSGPNVCRTATAMAGRIVRAMGEPFELGGQTFHAGASVGVAVYPDDAAQRGELSRHADVALYRAKTDGRGMWRRFNPTLHSELQARRELERDLREALGNHEIEAHFQPILDVASRRITRFEALMRWRHPRLGYVPPARFIPVAEDIGLIGALGEWMINEACRVAATLPDGLTVAINISAPQFRRPGLVLSVVRALAREAIEASRIEIEVTESVLMQDEPQVLKCMRQLRELGIGVSLDDFGTGYGSLSYLQRFPFDKIKIDRSFVRGLPDDTSSLAIAAAVTAMARQLGMVATAEGVETEAQREAVELLGCDEIQGYLIGRPTADPLALLAAEEAPRRVAIG